MYPPELTAPMAAELESQGFQSLHSATEVDQLLQNTEGTVLLVVNSVCGCAARNARPAAVQAMQMSPKKPTVCATVFAGVDAEATSRAREYLIPFPPSSPSIAILKNGKVAHMIERHEIEGRPAEVIASRLAEKMVELC